MRGEDKSHYEVHETQITQNIREGLLFYFDLLF